MLNDRLGEISRGELEQITTYTSSLNSVFFRGRKVNYLRLAVRQKLRENIFLIEIDQLDCLLRQVSNGGSVC